MYRAVVYDLDGTIVDSIGQTEKHFFAAAHSIGLFVTPLMRLQFSSYFRIERKNNFVEIIRRLWPECDADALRVAWQQVEIESAYALTVGAKETISTLAEDGIPQYVLTSRGSSTYDLLRQHDLESLFVSIYSLFGQAHNKPDPRCAEMLVADLDARSIAPRSVLYVGDTYHLDGFLARALGMEFVGITAGLHTRKEFLTAGIAPQHIIDVLPELLRFF